MRFTMKKLGVLILAAALFCGFSGFAHAKGGKGDGPARYMEQLNEAEQQQAKAIFDEGRNAAQSLRQEIASKKAELAEVMKSENPDSSRIEALSKELGQLRGKEMANRMETEAKLKQAGLPELKKPAKDDKRPEVKKDGKQDFASKRIANLPEAKQAEARRIYDEYQAETSQLRESVKAKRAELEKAKDAGDAAAVAAISTELGELKGKELVAKTELHQNLVKADIPADTFDRDGKKGDKKGKPGKDGKRGKDGKKGKDGKRGKGDKRGGERD